MTEYERTIAWLYGLEAAKGMDFKLERVALALQRLGDPQRRFPTLHVAGTNGKGSVAAMLHAILTAAGYRVGLYTSPHLSRLTERVRVGLEEEIYPADVVCLTREIQRVTSGGIQLTFFELMTVMAFAYFHQRAIDVGVIEVGLGGRLDATNVIDPAAAVITTIGCDHTQWLGDSIAAVAAEKGGIIKPHRPVVLGDVGSEAAAVLRELAAEREAPVIQAGLDYRVAGDGLLDFDGLGWSLRGLSLALRGAYQRENAGTALACLAAVREQIPVTEETIRGGLASVRWPGRLDVVAAAPLTILDGAHNSDAVAALVEEVRVIAAGRKLHVLFAVMGDKDWRPMVELLAPVCQSVTVTEVMPPRGQPAESVVEVFRLYCPAACERVPKRAWALVRGRAAADDAILVTGSLFLVGAIYPLCTSDKAVGSAEMLGALHP